jgi:methyl-accepting chemotaxis protein
VASEIRMLAQRNASAAKKVKALIEESVKRFNEGTHQVDTAGQTISEGVTSPGNAMSIMEEVNDACRAQTRQNWRNKQDDRRS